MAENFLIIDPQKNTLLVPAPSKGVCQAIIEAGVGNVKPHDSKRQLLLEIEKFISDSGDAE